MGFLWEEPPMKKYFVTLTTEERQSLHDLTAGGKTSARKLAHARILLKADQADGGPAWPDERIAEALDVGPSTIARVRQHFVEQGLEAALGRKPPRGQAPLTAALPGGRRLVPPGPSGRGRELPLGFEPVVPVGADGLAPRQPEVVGVERDRLGGGTPALSPGAEGRRNATRLDRLRLGTARRRGRQDFVLPRRGRGPGDSFPAGWALGHVRSLATWAARADTRLRERLACVPGLPLPRAGGWFAWIPLARSDPCPGGSDPRIRTAAAAAEPSGGVLWGQPCVGR